MYLTFVPSNFQPKPSPRARSPSPRRRPKKLQLQRKRRLHWNLCKRPKKSKRRLLRVHMALVLRKSVPLYNLRGPKPSGLPGIPSILANLHLPVTGKIFDLKVTYAVNVSTMTLIFIVLHFQKWVKRYGRSSNSINLFVVAILCEIKN